MSPSSSTRHLLAELFIIVIGVLIALGIDEWRENVENVRSERTYIEQLMGDLQATEELMARAELENKSSEDAALNLIAVFASGESVDPSHIDSLINQLRGYSNPVPIIGTGDAMVATGELQLIRDSSARSAIIQYLSYTRDYLLIPIYETEIEHRDYFERLFVRGLVHGVTPLDGKNTFKRNAKPNIETFLADSEAFAAISTLVRLKGDFKWYREEAAAAARELREKLEKLPI